MVVEAVVPFAEMKLFAERFLERPVPGSVPEPAGYDESLAISVTADGTPFVESVASALSTLTITKASGEAPDQIAGTITRTFTDGEGIDAPPEPPPMPLPPDPPDRGGSTWAVTITRADGERPDRGARPGSPFVASQATPAHTFWAITKTSAPGEKPDR